MHAFPHGMATRAGFFAVSYHFILCVFAGTAAILDTLAAVRMSVHHPVIHPAHRIFRDKFHSRAFCSWNCVYCGSINPRK
jgi:hypothetical protein